MTVACITLGTSTPARAVNISGCGSTFSGSTHTLNFTDNGATNGTTQYEATVDGVVRSTGTVTAPTTSISLQGLPTDGASHTVCLRPPSGSTDTFAAPCCAFTAFNSGPANCPDARHVSISQGTVQDQYMEITFVFNAQMPGRLKYRISGSTGPYQTTAEELTSNSLSHTQGVSGLTAGTTYEFISQTTTNGGTTWEDISCPTDFTTTGAVANCPDARHVSISQSAVGNTSMSVNFVFNQAMPGRLKYRVSGSNSAYTFSAPELSSTYSNHTQNISGLTASTTYEFTSQTTSNGGATWEDISCPADFSTTGGAASAPLANSLNLTGPNVSQGSWNAAQWQKVFSGGSFSQAYTPTNMDHLSLITEGSKQKIRQRHEAASNGSDRVIGPFNLNTQRTSFKLKQTIEVEFGWSWGTSEFTGKLGFGLGGGTNTDGGSIDTAGWTLRPSWDNGELTIYSYAATDIALGGNSPFGYEIPTGFNIQQGTPFELEIRVVMNTSTGVNNGTMVVLVNGNTVLNRSGIGYMTSGGTPNVNRVQWSEFHGGNGPQWSPTSTTYAKTCDVSWE